MRSQPLDDLKVFLEICSELSPMTLVLRLFLHSCFRIALPFSATHHSMYITYNSLFIPFLMIIIKSITSWISEH